MFSARSSAQPDVSVFASDLSASLLPSRVLRVPTLFLSFACNFSSSLFLFSVCQNLDTESGFLHRSLQAPASQNRLRVHFIFVLMCMLSPFPSRVVFLVYFSWLHFPPSQPVPVLPPLAYLVSSRILLPAPCPSSYCLLIVLMSSLVFSSYCSSRFLIGSIMLGGHWC